MTPSRPVSLERALREVARASGERGREIQELMKRLDLGSDPDGDGSGSDGALGDGGTGSGIPGDTFLHMAMRDEDFAELERLLAAGADPNSADCDGVTPLYMAAQRGLAVAVKELIAAGAAVDCQTDEGRTPLMAAVKGEHVECMQLLLSAGASLAAVDGDGDTALHWAAGRSAAVLDVLLAAPGVAQALQRPNNAGWIPLLLFAGQGDAAGVAALCGAGADATATGKAGAGALHVATVSTKSCPEETIPELLRAGSDPNAADSDGSTPLHLAAQDGRGPAARALLAGGARPNSQDGDGRTPLHYALIDGHAEVAEALLAAGADPLLADHEQGNNAFHVAANRGEITLMVEMCKGATQEAPQALLGARNALGLTPLLCAVHGSQAAAVRWLLHAGADPAAADKEGRMALHVAAQQEDEAILCTLLAHPGIHTSPADQHGLTPLHFAASVGNLNAVGRLLDNGASLEAEDSDGDRPLHWAAWKCQMAVAGLLLMAGAERGARNHSGHTALDIATAKEHSEVMAVLGDSFWNEVSCGAQRLGMSIAADAPETP